MGEERHIVMAGIVVDATRMHVTKGEWRDFLSHLAKAIGKAVPEFHSGDFYRGNGRWRGIQGPARAAVIEAVLEWTAGRKHRCIFSSIDKALYKKAKANDARLQELGSVWSAVATHCALQIQKSHQAIPKNKGHTVLVFDRETQEEASLSQLIHSPPAWTGTYYGHKKKAHPLDQIVDVPFFADSRHLLLAQIADLFAYVLRTSSEIQAGHLAESYAGEGARMIKWSGMIATMALPRPSRYPASGRCPATGLFWDLAPISIRELG